MIAHRRDALSLSVKRLIVLTVILALFTGLALADDEIQNYIEALDVTFSDAPMDVVETSPGTFTSDGGTYLGPEITGIVSDPSFETGSPWGFYASGTAMYYHGYNSSYKTDGTRSALIGPNNEAHSTNDITWIRQTGVDLTDVAALTFDCMKWSSNTKYRMVVRIDAVIVWAYSGYVNPWATGEVDVSAYSGTHTLDFGVQATATVSGVYCPCFFDNVRTWGPDIRYSISGTVTAGGSGLEAASVVVSGTDYCAYTNSSGDYTIEGVFVGSYTLIPGKAGYSFSPTTLPVTVGPNQSGNNFTATLNTGDGTTDYRALLIGTDAIYPSCVNDVNSLKAALLAGQNWSSGNITTLLNTAVTKSAVESAIAALAASADGDDVVLIYFAGHGGRYDDADYPPVDEPDDRDEFICPTSGGNINDDVFGAWINALPTTSYAVLIMTCHSGGNIYGASGAAVYSTCNVPGTGSMVEELTGGNMPGTYDVDDNGVGVVVTASNYDESAYVYVGGQKSVFGHFLNQGLAGPADDDGNHWISAEECHAYVEPLAGDYTEDEYSDRQYAQLYDGHGGDLDFLLVPPDLVISGLKVFDVTRTSAVVNWKTNLSASSEVGFDTDPKGSYEGYTSNATGPGGMMYHAVVLAGLTEDKTYYLRARSVDGYSRTTDSSQISFTTSDLQQPTLVYSGDTSGTCGAGETVTLAGTLTYDGAPLVDKTLNFVCNNWAGSGDTATDHDGKAEVVVETTRLGAGTHKVFVRFGGDDNYLPASARGQVEIAPDLTPTIVRGRGTFLRNGEQGHRCKVKFWFNADLPAGWLEFFDARSQKRISVAIVQSVALIGSEATIVCGPTGQYTVVVNAGTNSFSIVDTSEEPDYEASTAALRGDIVIEEGQP